MANHFEKFESYIPVDLMSWKAFFIACFVVYGFIVFRFFLMCGSFFFLYYKTKNSVFGKRQIYDKLPGPKEIRYEIIWSLWTSTIFAIFGVLIGLLWQMGWTQIYLNFNEYGYPYLFLSWVLLALTHDTYFYWTHILIHKKWLYKRIHAVHHASLKPSPWASFSFHPLESILEAAILPLLVILIPVHPTVLLFHLTFMTLTAISNHLGFEILPKSWKFAGRWFISGLHHSQHHRYFNYNYGLFFTFWDKICKTQHPQFEAQWEEV